MPKRRIHRNKIFAEDCVCTISRMSSHSIDVVVTSPPYNTGANYHDSYHCEVGTHRILGAKYSAYADDIPNEEYIKWLRGIVILLDRVLKRNGVILFNLSYSTKNTEAIWLLVSDIIQNTKFTIADCIVWKKPHCFPNVMNPNRLTRINEFVFVICRKKELDTFYCTKKHHYSIASNGSLRYKGIPNEVYADNNDGSCPYNKATFSTQLVEKLLKIYARPGSVVYDPFIGSGTTAVACVINSFDFIGSEIDEKQVYWANNRIRNAKENKK